MNVEIKGLTLEARRERATLLVNGHRICSISFKHAVSRDGFFVADYHYVDFEDQFQSLEKLIEDHVPEDIESEWRRILEPFEALFK